LLAAGQAYAGVKPRPKLPKIQTEFFYNYVTVNSMKNRPHG